MRIYKWKRYPIFEIIKNPTLVPSYVVSSCCTVLYERTVLWSFTCKIRWYSLCKFIIVPLREHSRSRSILIIFPNVPRSLPVPKHKTPRRGVVVGAPPPSPGFVFNLLVRIPTVNSDFMADVFRQLPKTDYKIITQNHPQPFLPHVSSWNICNHLIISNLTLYKLERNGLAQR
jgi:hypothetical protein